MKREIADAHPILAALFPPLFLYARNPSEVSFNDFLLVEAVALVLAGAVFIFAAAICRNLRATALLTTTALILFFTYGHVKEGVTSSLSSFDPSWYLPHRYMIPAWGVIFAAVLFAALRRRGRTDWVFPTRVVAIALAFLVIVSAVPLATYAAGRHAPVRVDLASRTADTSRPDIFFLMVDGYAGASTLEDLFGYNDSPFLDDLRARGFQVPSRSLSNYPTTSLSLGSMLNLDYIENLLPPQPADSTDPSEPLSLIRNNRFVDLVKAEGYEYALFETGWPPTSIDDRADMTVRCSKMTAYQEAIMRTSALVILASKLKIFEREKRERIECQFASLKEFATERSVEGPPAFVFVHLIVPHPPYVFGPEGEPVVEPDYENTNPEGVAAARGRYIDQLQYTNLRVEDAVDSILASARGPPVIVLLSDHGSAFDWNESPEFMRERLRNFEALYLPGYDAPVPETITPINVFRLVARTYLDVNTPALPDRSYFQPRGSHHYYERVDVTDIVGFD